LSVSIARFHEGDFSMRILVVGSTGTIGRAMVATSSAGNESTQSE